MGARNGVFPFYAGFFKGRTARILLYQKQNMKNWSKAFFSLGLLLLIVAYLISHRPIRVETLTMYLGYHLILAPLLVIIGSRFLKNKSFLIFPYTFISYVFIKLFMCIYTFWDWRKNISEEITFMDSVRFNLGLSSDFTILNIFFQDVLFFIWLIIFIISYYVLSSKNPKTNSSKHKSQGD